MHKKEEPMKLQEANARFEKALALINKEEDYCLQYSFVFDNGQPLYTVELANIYGAIPHREGLIEAHIKGLLDIEVEIQEYQDCLSEREVIEYVNALAEKLEKDIEKAIEEATEEKKLDDLYRAKYPSLWAEDNAMGF